MGENIMSESVCCLYVEYTLIFLDKAKLFRQQNFTNKIDAKFNIGNYSNQYRKYFLLLISMNKPSIRTSKFNGIKSAGLWVILHA
jgi:hypothetical protein